MTVVWQRESGLWWHTSILSLIHFDVCPKILVSRHNGARSGNGQDGWRVVILPIDRNRRFPLKK